jgi:hypothetical protein
LKHHFTIICLALLSFGILSAQEGSIQGVVTDEDGLPIPDVNILTSIDQLGTATDQTGFYTLDLPANTRIDITFTSLGFKKIVLQGIELQPEEAIELNPVMNSYIEQITTVNITNVKANRFEGITTIEPKVIRQMIGVQPGVENLLKSLPGVSSNNELSTQYNVRGGNFDENLIYINEIEVYRPFLIRSGQQEGLSIVNSDLIQDVRFSAGGFQAKYGDKLSSVLDITYRQPTQFGAGIDASFLGANAYAQGVSKDKKLSGIVGMRYRDNSLFVNSRETEAIARPRFFDTQAHLTYAINKKWNLSFLGHIAVNDYEFTPLTSQTNFGTVSDAQALVINYEGGEDDLYETYFGPQSPIPGQ